MKCIHCQRDCKYKERPERKCPGCGHPFAFEPQDKDPVTDALFLSAIVAVSADNRLRWGVEHLYYEVCRRKRARRGPALGGLLVSIAVGAFVFGVASGPPRFFVPLIVFGLGVGNFLYVYLQRCVKIDRDTFARLWERWLASAWCRIHGSPEGLIQRREPPKQERTVEPDVADYSFDRAVICDRARTVDLLLANHFHFENNCAILSIDGYPPGPFQTVREMLRRNPHLQVFVLHDATPAGCRLAHQLSTDPEWFAGKVRVIDVGLRPRHERAFRGLFQRSPEIVRVGNGIDLDEARWLSHYSLELAAVRPEQVLKRLFQAINRKFDPGAEAAAGTTSDGGWEVDIASFSSDAGDSDGGADSFG